MILNLLARLTLITFRIITLRISGLSHAGGDGLQRDGTLQTLPFHFTGHLIGQTYVTVHQKVGGGAAAAAIKSCETIFAAFF